MQRFILILAAAIAILSLNACAAQSTHPAPAGLQGRWTGNATIVVNWVQQTQLLVQLDIAADGSVNGTVGDATLANATLRQGRGSIERALGWSRDWRIHGQLHGDLIAAEHMRRDAVDIPFDQTANGMLCGGLTSSGTAFGGKNSMQIAAGQMTLRRAVPGTTRPATQGHQSSLQSPTIIRAVLFAPATDEYRMELAVSPAECRLEGKETLRYRNLSSSPLAAVRLRLDPNMSTKQLLEIIRVEDATGQALGWKFLPIKFGNLNSDRGAVEIALTRPVPPAGDTTISIRFRSSGNQINTDMVMLQDDPYHSLDAWYPKAMTPRDDGGWSIDDDRLANYDVTVKMPSAYTVASTGRRVNEPVAANSQTELHLQAKQIRGFSIIASASWQRHTRQAGQVELAVYLPAEARSWADRVLDTAADAIAFYEKEYAPYPSNHLDIICPGSLSDTGHGGSTACNLITVFLGGQLEQTYRFLIAHEVAHQYFSVRVGFPRDSMGWVPVGLGMMMDEHYAVARGLDANYGRGIMRDFYFRAEQMGFDTTLSQSVQVALQSPAPWSFGWNMSLAHGKAYAVCAMLRDLLGPEKFQGVVQTLVRERSGGLVREADLIAACEAALGEPLDWFVADWINGRAKFDYVIRSVQKSDDGWNVEVARVGTGSFPAQVELTTEDGKNRRLRADRTKVADILHFKIAGAVKTVRLNPDGVYPDLNAADDVWPLPEIKPTTRPR